MKIGDVLYQSGDVSVVVVDSTPIKLEIEGIGVVGTIGGGLALELHMGGTSIIYHADVESVIADAKSCAAYRASKVA